MNKPHNLAKCPKCKGSFKGQLIPKKDRHHFGGAKFFRRDIVLYDRDLDRTVAHKCPNCGYTWGI